MRAASVDLRERVVAAVGAGEPTSGVARRLGIGRATVDRSVRQHRATGDRRPKPLPGARPLIGTDQQPALRAPLEAAPAATLAEHCATWEGAQGVRVSSDTLRRAIARLGWRRKKTLVASEQDPDARAAWLRQATALVAEDLVVSDETRLTTTLSRRSARAPGGQRARGRVPRHHRTGTPRVAALTTTGLTAALTLPGALATPAFLVYRREVLCPTRRPGQVVLLDNRSVHQAAAAERRIAAAGCRLLFLPPDSPDFSPIALAFAQLKAFLRSVAARPQAAVDHALAAALDLVSAHDANAYFRHAGYRLAAQSP